MLFETAVRSLPESNRHVLTHCFSILNIFDCHNCVFGTCKNVWLSRFHRYVVFLHAPSVQWSRPPEARGLCLLYRSINDGAKTRGFGAILPSASCWLAAWPWLGQDVWETFCPTLRTHRLQTDSRLRKNCTAIAINTSTRATDYVADGFNSASGREGRIVSEERIAEIP